jgi:Na+-transporting NADH:ubiquinone oxidoreductase subunit A
MKTIRVKNTYDLRLTGQPSNRVRKASVGKTVSVLPTTIPLIKPKMAVKAGDTVKVGTPLFYDKRDENIKFLSPGAGTIREIVYGPRRCVDQVIIDLSSEESFETFEKVSIAQLKKMTREAVTTTIQNGGLWGVFTEHPFRNIPRSTTTAPAIYVTVDNDEPFLPQSKVYLNGREDDFKFGLSILQSISDKVYVGVSSKNDDIKSALGGSVTHEIEGAYPANNPGVFLYYNKESEADNKSWSIKGQDVLRLTELFREGKYPIHKLIVVAGDHAETPSHVLVREGMPITDIVGKLPAKPTRYIAGGVLTGRQTTAGGSLGFSDYAIHLIREGKETDMLTFFKPGFDKPTFGRTYMSSILSSSLFKMNTSLNGGYRACVSCGECPKVCPNELLPQLLMKEVLAGDTEEVLEQGFLDCAGCGLCTYVCPSKIDLDTVFDDAREKLYWEVEK